ncbi:allergen Tha p 1-like [Choristoneura fumiferana]|uniref:allergen Tha p 1-like n=1 Tax=Choristoneura fumiferana TaxID=7141 RepID=UPI003D15DDC9
MDLYLILLICVGVPLVSSYDQKFDMIDIEAIVNNDFIHRAVNVCILGEVDCGPYWDEVKELAPEIAKDHCAHCTPRQQVVIKTYVSETKRKYPKTWNKISKKYKK